MTLRAQAYDAFTRQLLERRLVPGQFVTQRDLAALVGFPLGAIREMIPRLETEGLIRTLAQRGLQITAADPRLIRYAFQMREMIESEAIIHYVRTAPDEAIEAGVASLAEIMEQARAGRIDPALVARAQAVDWGFHDTIVESLQNPLLNDVHRVNAIRIRLMMYDRVTLTPEVLAPALEEHRPILDAVRRRDGKAALKALKSHLASARRRALALDEAPPYDTKG
jgi:DNA-binding GntR family transcriptional regulator